MFKMFYWLSVTAGLMLGLVPIFYYFKACVERDRMGFSSPYSRAENAKNFSNPAEHSVYEALKQTVDTLVGPGRYFLSKGALIFKHAPGRAVPTCEIDHLLICRFGIFVVETKDWGGAIRPSTREGEVIVRFANGHEELRRSPISQSASKVAFIKRCQPVDWRVESIAVFANAKASLSSGLPKNMVLLADLESYLRAKSEERMSGEMRYVDKDIGMGTILPHRDNRPDAAEIHRVAVQRAHQR
jgi:Nuclease-related domain